MDILISSNLERLLFEFSGRDDSLIAERMASLKSEGKYSVTAEELSRLNEVFAVGYATEEETADTIDSTYDLYDYLMDTHTAVAYKVYKDYKTATGDETKTIVASTANPYKFGKAVYSALGGETEGLDEFTIIEKLEQQTGTKMPAPLAATKNKPVRFTGSVEKQEMPAVVLDFLKK